MNTSISYRFPKKEKLKSRKQIEKLFSEGRRFSNFPLRVLWLVSPGEKEPGLQVGVTVSSRYFKKAVDRNRIKRLLRESIRLQKHSLQHTVTREGKCLQLFLIYNSNEMPEYTDVYYATGKVLHRLDKMLQEMPE